MKFCPNCGEELDEDSNFCANCGNSLSDNVKNKSNINQVINKLFSDIINPLLKRPKLLLCIIVVLIFIIGITSIFNSGSNIGLNTGLNTLDGQEITVYGVNFNIPNGFRYYELVAPRDRESQFSLTSEDGKQKYIHIQVTDISPGYSAQKSSMANSKITVNGKDCYIYVSYDKSYVYCAYDTSNGKTVQLNIPYSYTYNNKVVSYEELLANMIR